MMIIGDVDRPVSLGLDFGTESVRAIFVDTVGQIRSAATHAYRHGQITRCLPESDRLLPEKSALQCPADWIDSASIAVRDAFSAASIKASQVVGIGVDFTSCTMLPTLCNGQPLCEMQPYRTEPLAWPKLWKHHSAIEQTARMNSIAKERNEAFLARYGGTIGLEWFFPKLLETIENAPEVADAAEVWLEAGDWLVWQLVGCDANELPRSTCQAGYKALWSAADGYANDAYLNAVDPRLAQAVNQKMPGRMLSPGQRAGTLTQSMADRLGLLPGIAVSAATIDAHAAVPGIGAAEPGTLVMVLGTSSCHMLNAMEGRSIAGVAGIVQGGILPGLFGYETGQAAVGDAFAWLLKLLNLESFDQLSRDALAIPAGSDGVTCLDWMNGCRTPLMDGSLSGAFIGLTLGSTPAHLYRAMLEGSACGVRWIIDVLRSGGLSIDRIMATGGLPHHNPDVVRVYADVVGEPIEIHPTQQATAVGAAVLGMCAAGESKSGFKSIVEAARSMASSQQSSRIVVEPDLANQAAYDHLYQRYRRLADFVKE